MKKLSLLPAIVLGATAFFLSTSVVAGTYNHTSKPVDPVTGFFHATGAVVSGVGHAAVGMVGGVAHGTAYVVHGVAHTTTHILSGGRTTTVHHQVRHVNY